MNLYFIKVKLIMIENASILQVGNNLSLSEIKTNTTNGYVINKAFFLVSAGTNQLHYIFYVRKFYRKNSVQRFISGPHIPNMR